MSEQKKPYYITTAIAYASAKPHIGNTYDAIMADAIARYRRKAGYDVYLCTGADEHGQKIQDYAEKAGTDPQAYVDKISGEIRGIWDLMNVKYDRFIRTTEKCHVETVQKIFERFLRQGDIYKGKYEGWYCKPCESFYTETQVVDGKCPDCGAPVTRACEEAYFFDMKKYAPALIEYINTHPEFIEPESRKKEMLNNFLLPGLQDLCLSRTSFTWGIKVPSDPRHVVYVWLDALTNYITAIGYDPDKSYEEQSERFRELWPASVHVIGKDIMRFHGVYWPIFLMALGLPLPQKIFGHPWFNFGTGKMSKSKGNVVYADKLSEYVGVDGVRYYALAEMPYGSDGSITYESLIERFNTDLANTLGNLVNRTIAMAQKYFGGVIQPADATEPVDADLRATALKTVEEVDRLMNQYRMADTLDAVISLARRSNKYIDETMPWVLAKDEAQKPRLGAVLYNLLESIRFLAVLLQPFMPETAEKIFAQLNTDCKDYASLSAFGGLHAGDKVGEPVPLFGRIDAEQMLQQLKAKQEAAAAPAQEPAQEAIQLAPEISIEDFAKVELRVAKVLSAEKVKKSSKLLCIQLDDGMGGRQVVSGIAKWYKPEELVGKKVIVVANLKPVKLCGVESNGMICAADLPDGSVRVLFADDSMACGAKIR